MSDEEELALRLKLANETPGELKWYDCKKCLNKGFYAVNVCGELVWTECECAPNRRTMRIMIQSGLQDIISRYTFKTYIADNEWTENVKKAAMDYAFNREGWMMVSGTPGTGKTHICTAVCGDLIKVGYEVRYMLWRAEAPVLKAQANEIGYTEAVRPYKYCKVLYIDDFLKGKVTDADLNLAFDIINARYNNPDLMTIISSELSLETILDYDQALGSRIYERKSCYIDLTDKPNRRLS